MLLNIHSPQFTISLASNRISKSVTKELAFWKGSGHGLVGLVYILCSSPMIFQEFDAQNETYRRAYM